MDDRYYLAWVTSGYLTGEPDYHTFFMNAIYSWIESKLYLIAPSVEWHTWLLLVIHVFSFTSVGFCLLKKNCSHVVKKLSLAILYLLEIYLLTNLQFTTTAGLAATAGVMLIITRRNFLIGCTLFITASMIRHPSAMFCGLIMAAFYPLLILRQGYYQKQFFALILCAMGTISLHLIDKQIYLNNPEWKEKYEFNKLRSAVFDNSNTWRIYINPPEGLHSRDFDVMGTVSDTIEWTESVYHKCLDEIEKQTTWHGIRGIKKVKNIPNELSQFWLWFLVLIPIMFFCISNCSNIRERLACLIGLMSFPLAMAIIALNTRLVLHAFLCGWIPVLFLSICIIPIKKKIPSSIWLALATLLLLPCIIPHLYLGQPTSKSLFHQQMELVRTGEKKGAKCFVIDCKTEKCEYPFGVRYRFCTPDTRVEHLDNVTIDMVKNEKCVFLLAKESWKNAVESIGDRLIRESGKYSFFSSQEIAKTDSYYLFYTVLK